MHNCLGKFTDLVPLYPECKNGHDEDSKWDGKRPEDPKLVRYLEPGAVRTGAEERGHGEYGLVRAVPSVVSWCVAVREPGKDADFA